jgi:hypothetical protein
MNCRTFSWSDKRLKMSLSSCLMLLSLGCGSTHSTSNSSLGLAGSNTTPKAITGPVLGYLWDPVARGLRTIYGIPGAANEGAAFFNDGTFSGAIACSQKSFALLTAKTGEVFVANLPNGEPIRVAAKLSAKQQVLLSPSCSSALIYAPDSTNALLISGLPASSQTKSLSLSAGSILATAVADSGSVLIATVRTDGSANIQAVPSGSTSAVQVGLLSQFGGMAFLPLQDEALLGDAGKNVILLTSPITGNATLMQVAASADGISQPVAVAASADGKTALVANSSGAATVRIDLSRQTPSVKVACQCSPSELVPLSGNLVFRLNEPGPGTVWAFDGDSATSRIVFLPTERVTSVAGAAQ